MNIRKKFNTKEEYEAWALNILNICEQGRSTPLWKEEDLPKLEPWFAYSKNLGEGGLPTTSQEIMDSLEFYKKCIKDYAGERMDIRDTVGRFDPLEIANLLCARDLNEGTDDDHYNFHLMQNFPYSFPLIAVGVIECGDHRGADDRIAIMDFVSLSDFTEPLTHARQH